MIPAYNTRNITPRTERMIGQAMMTMRVKEGWHPDIGKAWTHVTQYGARLLREMDGGAMYRDDAISLADIGESDVMCRAIDRLVSRGVVEEGTRDGRTVLYATDKADTWLARHGAQGSLW